MRRKSDVVGMRGSWARSRSRCLLRRWRSRAARRSEQYVALGERSAGMSPPQNEHSRLRGRSGSSDSPLSPDRAEERRDDPRTAGLPAPRGRGEILVGGAAVETTRVVSSARTTARRFFAGRISPSSLRRNSSHVHVFAPLARAFSSAARLRRPIAAFWVRHSSRHGQPRRADHGLPRPGRPGPAPLPAAESARAQPVDTRSDSWGDRPHLSSTPLRPRFD
jgi:hypothetical protein